MLVCARGEIQEGLEKDLGREVERNEGGLGARGGVKRGSSEQGEKEKEGLGGKTNTNNNNNGTEVG